MRERRAQRSESAENGMAKANGANGSGKLTRTQYLDLYYYRRPNRAVEETMVKLFRQNKIVGGLYSSLGQEAVSVGTAYALGKKDWLGPPSRHSGGVGV